MTSSQLRRRSYAEEVLNPSIYAAAPISTGDISLDLVDSRTQGANASDNITGMGVNELLKRIDLLQQENAALKEKSESSKTVSAETPTQRDVDGLVSLEEKFEGELYILTHVDYRIDSCR